MIWRGVLTHIRLVFSRNFRECHEMIMGDAPRTDKAGLEHELYVHARNFYGLVHARFVVTLRGVQLHLTTYEFSLLKALAERAGRVLSREQLVELVRGSPDEAFDRSIDVHVSRLRQKLGDDPRQPTLLKTVRGAGYVLSPKAGR